MLQTETMILSPEPILDTPQMMLKMDIDTINRERIDLLKKRMAQGLTVDDENHLAELTEQKDAHVNAVAPLPFARLTDSES